MEEDDAAQDEVAKRYVQAHFEDKVLRQLPVREFVRAVWNFTAADMPDLDIACYTLPIDTLNRYLQCQWKSYSCQPLMEIIHHVLSQISFSDRPEPKQKRLGKRKCFRLRKHTLKGDYSWGLKSDLAWGTAKCDQCLPWEWCPGFIEVKKVPWKPLKRKTDVEVL